MTELTADALRGVLARSNFSEREGGHTLGLRRNPYAKAGVSLIAIACIRDSDGQEHEAEIALGYASTQLLVDWLAAQGATATPAEQVSPLYAGELAVTTR